MSATVSKRNVLLENTTLKINEIFFSIQGESTFVGLPTIFIRLTGCPLRCQYCDTEYAFHDGEKMSIQSILQNISNFRSRFVTVTGGEPLAQKSCLTLLTQLCDEGYQVSLETSGAMDVAEVDERVSKIIDIKTPGSKESEKNRFDNLKYIKPDDEIKFVICNRDDYLWTKKTIQEHQLTERCEILLSSSHDELSPTDLADWVIEDQLTVRLQLQMHKYLWGDSPGK